MLSYVPREARPKLAAATLRLLQLRAVRRNAPPPDPTIQIECLDADPLPSLAEQIRAAEDAVLELLPHCDVEGYAAAILCHGHVWARDTAGRLVVVCNPYPLDDSATAFLGNVPAADPDVRTFLPGAN